ncbi:MAG: hypothetical protein O3A00_26235 [Planctomycetota bacterium]|nr:hypothetical protein [Planctomycetota bacterium]
MAHQIGEINRDYLHEDHAPQGWQDALGDEALHWGYARKFVEAAIYAQQHGMFTAEMKSQLDELIETLKDPQAMARFVAMMNTSSSRPVQPHPHGWFSTRIEPEASWIRELL